MVNFELNSRLKEDTFFVGNLPLSQMLLMNDSRYPWVILVPRLDDITEIHQLSNEDQQQLLYESSAVSELILDKFPATKMNVAVLGNIVPQLHLHHIGRKAKDPAWPGPVWGHSPAVPYEQADADKVIKLFQQIL